jgi:hypothetical protein
MLESRLGLMPVRLDFLPKNATYQSIKANKPVILKRETRSVVEDESTDSMTYMNKDYQGHCRASVAYSASYQ